MKHLLLLLSFITLFSCSTVQTAYYGVMDVEVTEITRQNNEYVVEFVVHVGKDADYYTLNYYVDNEFLYSEKHDVVNEDAAKYSHGYINGFIVNEPATVTLEVTSYIGDGFLTTDTKTFTIEVK